MYKEGISKINSSEAIIQIMQLLGMQEMDVISFSLYAEIGKFPTVDVTYYLKDMPPIPLNMVKVTQTFKLIPCE